MRHLDPYGFRSWRTAPARFWLICLAALALAGCQGGSNLWPFSTSGDKLSDGEIARVALTLNRGEVLTSEPARRQASNAQVRQFAQRMVSEHQNTQDRLEREARNAGIEPIPNDISNRLDEQAQKIVEELSTKRGREFDQTYIKAQVKLHRDALKMLEDTLIPAVDNGRLRDQLTQMRKAVAEHLKEAEQLERSLSS